VHATVAVLFVAVESLLYLIAHACGWPRPVLPAVGSLGGMALSPWWWLPGAVLAFGLLPAWLGFWLTPKPGTTASLSLGGLVLWLLGLAGSISALALTGSFALPLLAIGVLILAWLWQEAALWGTGAATSPATRGIIARNRLTSVSGIGLGLLLGSLVWVLLDTLAGYAASRHSRAIPGLMGLIAASLPALRSLVTRAIDAGDRLAAASAAEPKPASAKLASVWQRLKLGVVAFGLLGFFVFSLDVLTYWAFDDPIRGRWVLAASWIASLVMGRLTGFVNLSSLQALYAARLARTYLGAANEERVHAADSEPKDVDAAHPQDDVFLHDHHPEEQGGPLHLINVCVNETVDMASGRQLAEDKGLAMCLGPEGVSVGVRFHALWEMRRPEEEGMPARMLRRFEHPQDPSAGGRRGLRALPVAPDPAAFHVLASRDRSVVEVESLRLSQWVAISGAAVSTGQGRSTSLPVSLLLGLFNVRLGYWWSSNINSGDRPGRYPPSLWRALKAIPGHLFRTQATILNEWRAYFPGPSRRLWYLTDGGHSDNTSLYELIRRRLPFMLAIDAGHDPAYSFDDLGLLVRRVRLDFGAQVTWIDPTDARKSKPTGWDPVQLAAGAAKVPAWIQAWLNPDALGDIGALTRRGSFAAVLAHIDYVDSAERSWLVVLKACLSSPPPTPLDVECYAKANETFPNESTVDQFFDDDQWESYRLLAQRLTETVLA
jgi:hypothetical protein